MSRMARCNVTAACLLALVLGSPRCIAAPEWPRSETMQTLVDEVLPASAYDWNGPRYAEKRSRAATYLSAGLLWRDAPGDRQAAIETLEAVLAMQYDDPADSKRHGVWRRRKSETQYDPNWREFVGSGLILIREQFRDRLPPSLQLEIDACLLRAAEGALARNVGPAYTNISLQSAFLIHYVGTTQNREDLSMKGLDLAEKNYKLFLRNRTFFEFNSPTYYGTDLMALALWRKHGPSDAMRKWGSEMETALWQELACFYHPEMKNMCGPFVRSYGMDMTQYCALSGLWIAMAIDDPATAPWPAEGGRDPEERVFGPVFALLEPELTSDVIESLTKFQGPRRFERVFDKSRAHVLMEENLMIGAAGLRHRRDRQHHPATIYWRPEEGESVGWILMTGENDGLVPKLNDRSIEIRRQAESGDSLQLLVFAPNLTKDSIKPGAWNLPGLNLDVDVHPGITLSQIAWIDHYRYGKCLDVRYDLKQAHGEAVLTLHVEKPE